jgi:hypothetical protein
MRGPGPGHNAPSTSTDALNTPLGVRYYHPTREPAGAPIKPTTPNMPNTPHAAAASTTTTAPPHPTPRPTTTPQLTTPPTTHNGHRIDYYGPLACIHQLDSHLASLSNAPYSFDSKRLHVLRTALDSHDYAYLTMHQYYTLHTYYARQCPSAALPQQLLQQPNLPVAFDMMRFVIQSNDLLSPQCLRFCAAFPYQLQHLQDMWPVAFQHESRAFIALVQHSYKFDTVRVDCEKRGFGPLAHELVHLLGIVSPTFQVLTFTALSRRIHNLDMSFPMHAQFEGRLLALFRQSQAHLAIISARHPSWHTIQQNWDNEVRLWGSRLLDLPPPLSPLPRTHPVPRPRQAVNQRIHTPRTARAVHPSNLPLPAQPPRRVPLLPRPGWALPQQRIPVPARFALHQANLRSPTLQAQDAAGPLYHYWESFLLAPRQLTDADRAVNKLTFSLVQGLAQHLAAVVPTIATGACETMNITEHSKTCRLRCVKLPASDPPSDHTWAISETSWIPYSYFTLNGTSLQQRKKKHHGKDRPIEITRLLKEGDNVLEVAVMSEPGDSTYQNYLIAAEVLGIMTHSFIQQQCRNNMRSKETCLNDIKTKLSGGNDGDDDIAVVESSLTISICDPFSGSILNGVPVRSTACIHHDCFDLDTFLQTRPRRGHASVSDQWRCPVCNADARPALLFVDGFLEDVRTQLDREGLSHTRAIVVDQHGSWKPKAETRDPNSVRDATPDEESPAVVQVVPPALIEIIDLDD